MIDYEKPIMDKDGKPIKIGLLAAHHCIRVIKQARALKKLGYTIYGNGDKTSYGNDIYDAYFVWKNERQFKNTVKMLIDQGVTLVSWANEPDHPVAWIRQVINDMGVQDKVKVVVDLHDLDSVRRGIIPIPEREMFNCADGLIYVSLPIQDMTNKLQGVNIPNIVLYSYCNDGIIEYDLSKMGDRHGLVYEGGANSPGDQVLNEAFAYRSLYEIMKRLVEMGNETTMFCGNFDAFQSYQNIGMVLKPPTDYDEMMRALVNYKYGILVFNNEGNTEAQVKYTLTNKAQEYLQAGLPSLACWCEESIKWVEKHGIGFTFNHLNDIGNCSQLEDKYLSVVETVTRKRKELVMENFIWKTENLYADLLGLERKGIPDKIKEINIFEYGEQDVSSLLT